MITLTLIALLAQQPSQPPKPDQSSQNPSAGSSQQQAQPQSPPPVTVIVPEKSAQELENERRRNEFQDSISADIRDYTFWLTLVGAAQLLAAFLGLVWTRKAASAAQTSAEVATQTLRLTQRAYLQPVNWTLEPLAADKLPQVGYQIKNLGHTPARVVSTASASYRRTRPKQPDKPALIKVDEGGLTIGRGATLGKSLNVQPAMTAEEVESLNKGETEWFIYLQIVYLDIFNKERTHQTCMRYSARQKALVSAPNAQYERSD